MAQVWTYSTMVGTYDSTAGTAGDGGPCGTVQTGLQWSAVLVPPMTGNVQGNFHSTGGAAGLNNQDFLVSGSLTQAENTGASSATVSGTLNFSNSDYPCFTYHVGCGVGLRSNQRQLGHSAVRGTSGDRGSDWGASRNRRNYGAQSGNFRLRAGWLYFARGWSLLLSGDERVSGQPGSTVAAGDYGDICLSVGSALGTANACQQPISLTPASLTFPALAVGKTATQTISLVNQSNGALNGLVLAVTDNPANATNFTETDICGFEGVPSLGQPFALTSGQACAITVTFAPRVHRH